MSNCVAVSKPAAATRTVHDSPLPCSPTPSVAQPFASIWQKLPPSTTLKGPLFELVVGGEVVGELVVGAEVGGAEEPTAQQMVQPSFVTEKSLRHVNVEPAATATPLGPVLPWYRVPPMVT